MIKKLLFMLLFPVLLHASGGDTLRYSTRVLSLADADTFFSDIHWHPMKDTIQSIINGRLGNQNIAADALIKPTKLDSNDTIIMLRIRAKNLIQTDSIAGAWANFDTLQSFVQSGDISAGTINANFSSVTTDTVRADGAGGISLFDDGNNGLHVEDGGEVSIGVLDGDGNFHSHSGTAGSVAASTSADEGVFENSAAGGISILTPDAADGNIVMGSPSDIIGCRLNYQYDTKLFKIGTNLATGQLVFESGNAVECARFDANGNFGIGTPTPSNLLEVYGNPGDAGIEFADAGNIGYVMGLEDGTNYFEIAQGDALGTDTRLVIMRTTGFTGIDTTAPGSMLHVAGSIRARDTIFAAVYSVDTVQFEKAILDVGVITDADINGGTIDGVTIGGTSAPTVTDLGSVATCDINGGTIDGATIGASVATTGEFSTIIADAIGFTKQQEALEADSITIATDQSYSDITNEAAAAFDTLSIISGGSIGSVLIIKSFGNDSLLVLDRVDASTNLFINGDFIMNSSYDMMLLMKVGETGRGSWAEISRSDNN